MKKKVLLSLAIAVALGVSAAYPLAFASGGRSDCPGKIVCSITGKVICSDQCPAESSASNDVAEASCCAASE